MAKSYRPKSLPRFLALAPIEPEPLERLAVDQRFGSVNTGPFHRRLGEAFLDRMAEVVFQPAPLDLGLVADDDAVIAVFPEGSLPFPETSANFLRNVATEMLHESRQLLLVSDDQ